MQKAQLASVDCKVRGTGKPEGNLGLLFFFFLFFFFFLNDISNKELKSVPKAWDYYSGLMSDVTARAGTGKHLTHFMERNNFPG